MGVSRGGVAVWGRGPGPPTCVFQGEAELPEQPQVPGHRFQHGVDDDGVPRAGVGQQVGVGAGGGLKQLRRGGKKGLKVTPKM